MSSACFGSLVIGGDGQPDAAAGEQLQAAELVAAPADGDRLVQRINAHHLELAEHGKAVKGDRGADTRDHRVEILEPPLAVIEHRLARGDVDGDAQRVEHLDVVAARARRLDDAPMAVEMRIAREQRDLHWRSRRRGDNGSRAAPCSAQARSMRAIGASAAAGAPARIGTARLDQRAAFERRAPEQHAEAHLIAIGKRKLDRPGAVAEHEAGLDDVAALDPAAGVAHGALVDGLRLAFDLHRARALEGMHLEAHPERAGAPERLDGDRRAARSSGRRYRSWP